MRVVVIRDGETSYVKLREPIMLANGLAVSLQASSEHCSRPRANGLNDDDYESVEVVISRRNPNGTTTILTPLQLGIPEVEMFWRGYVGCFFPTEWLEGLLADLKLRSKATVDEVVQRLHQFEGINGYDVI